MENQIIAERYKARLQTWIHSSQAMVDFSKMSLRGAMLLNGAGVIPIVYSKVDYLYDSALLFGVGALLAACATGTTYLAQWAITAAFDTVFIRYPFRASALAQEEEKVARQSDLAYRFAPWLRGASILLVCASLVAFACGLYSAHSAISSTLPAK